MTQQELKWWHVRWRAAWRAVSRPAAILARVIVVLCLVAALVCGVTWVLAPWLGAKRMCKIDPRVCLVPAGLPTNDRAPLSDAAINSYGFRFSLPRQVARPAAQGDTITIISLSNAGTLTFANPSKQFEILDIIVNDKKGSKILGQDLLQSKFKLMQAAMATTPDQATWWRFRTSANTRVQFLLVQKFLFLNGSFTTQPFTLGPIYSISVGGFHGFQIGNPDVSPYDAHIDLFDANDRHLAINVTGPENHGPVLTQAEINAMLASIRPN